MTSLGNGVDKFLDFLFVRPSVCDTVRATNRTCAQQHYTFIWREKIMPLFPHFCRFNNAAQKLIKLACQPELRG